jgi:DNA primase small subunit
MSQADDIKPEAEKSKVSLEDMFDDDDDDSDGEFASSAPVKSEEESSQPAPVYVCDP